MESTVFVFKGIRKHKTASESTLIGGSLWKRRRFRARKRGQGEGR